MSNQTQDPNYIPADDEIKQQSGNTWRFAGGAICKGSERLGTYATRDKVVGRLQRVGIHTGTTNDGRTYSQVEADVLTREGVVHLKSAITDDEGRVKSSIATNGFAWGLLQVAPNELIQITASKGEPTPKGGIPTYVNFARIGAGNNASPIYKGKRSATAPKMTVLEQWEELEPELRRHPAYAERPSRDDDHQDGDGHYAELLRETAEWGWPTPTEAPADWLAMLAKLFSLPQPRASLRDHTDDEWRQVRMAFADQRAKSASYFPASLAAARDRIAKTKAAADTGGYDPFTDTADVAAAPASTINAAAL